MSEELATGHDFVEANHGLKPAPTEPEQPEPKTYSGDRGLIDAANDLTAERGTSEQEPIERHLEWKTGHRAGERVDMKAERFSLSAEQAAKTLSEVHRNEDARDLNPLLNDLAHEVDLARAQASGRPDPVQEAPPVNEFTPEQPDSPQAEAGTEPSTPGIDPDFAKLLSEKPQLRAQLEAPFQQAEAARQAFAGATQQIADVALSSVLANFPELQGVSGAELPTVLSFIQKNDPVKAQAIQNQLQQVNVVYQQAQQAKAVQAQQAYAEFQLFTKQQDAAFENATRNENPETVKAAAKEIVDFAKASGISQEALFQLWQTNPVLRSAPFQLMLLDAAKYRMAQRTAMTNRAPHSLPSVQRPGVASSAGERSTVDLSDLRDQFRKASGNDQLRAAVKLQQAQRRARG